MRPFARRLLALFLALIGAALVTAGILAVTLGGARPLPVAAIVLLLFTGAALAAFFPLHNLGRRFDAIAASAETMIGGDLSARAPVDAHDDVASLARALNDLAKRSDTRLRELTAERDSSEAVLSNLPQGLALITRDLRVAHANERFWALVGVDLSGLGLPARLSLARQPILEELVIDSITRKAPVTREVALYLEEKRDYEISVRPIAARNAWLLAIEDLRPEKALAALRREFVSNASHELKTPLTSIRGYAETLLAGGLEDLEHRARFVETIRAQAARLETLVENLLELADLDRPDSPVELKDWDLSVIAREMGDTFQDAARRLGLVLEVIAPPGAHARVDRTKIELALRNLLDNAIKYTEAGTVTLLVERKPSAVRVTVADTGRGIAPEHVPRLFERFYRVDRGRSRTLGGTGLGLSIVKHSVLLHGGQVGVESTPNLGSVFWFEIPVDGPGAES